MSQTLKSWIEDSSSTARSEEETAQLFAKILFEVHASHKNNDVIRTLSPQKIVINDDGSIKITNNIRFSLPYVAPELFRNDSLASETLDIYSLGIMLYEMLTQSNYWDLNNYSLHDFKYFIENESHTGIDESEIAVLQPFSQILMETTQKDPRNRPSSVKTLFALLQQAFPHLNLLWSDSPGEHLNDTQEADMKDKANGRSYNSHNEAKDDDLNDPDFEDVLEPVQGRAIGIDLGTTNSVVSYVEHGKVKTLRLKNRELIPSAIYFEAPDKIFYGSKALKKGLLYPNSLVKLFKRKLKDQKDKIQVEYNKSLPSSTTSKGYTYLIDTNVFIHEPNILDKFQANETLIVSTKVMEELFYRRRQKETANQAQQAIDNIFRHQHELTFEHSMLSILPPDLDPRQNDNLILSIALKLKDEDLILLTSDRDLQWKCQQYNIHSQSLSDFLSGQPAISVNRGTAFQITGEEATTLFLRFLKDQSAINLGPVSNAVITVPANFNNVQIEATKKAAQKAGFEEVVMFKEPTAAAIAYGLEAEENKKILVYDFGGGTFDVSIIEAKSDQTFTVLNTGGDANLGGEELTEKVVEFIYDELDEDFDLDMSSLDDSELTSTEYTSNKKQIYQQAEAVKIELSELKQSEINLNLYVERDVKRAWSRKLSRNEFENLVRDQVKKTLDILNKTLNDTQLFVTDIDIIVLAGGTALMPMIQDRVQKHFGKLPNYEKNTATVISQGAAILASSKWPSGQIREIITINEKTTADFGVAVKGRIFDVLIPLGSNLPTKVQKSYAPVKDNQETLRISVFRRDKLHPTAKRTFDEGIDFVDEINIVNLPPMKMHEAVIAVTFELTKEDILKVEVEVRDSSGTLIDSQGMSVERSSGMA